MAIQGGYDYRSGTGSVVVSIPTGATVVQITARGELAADMCIGDGDHIAVYPSFGEVPPVGNMVGPFDITFANVDTYFVSWIA